MMPLAACSMKGQEGDASFPHGTDTAGFRPDSGGGPGWEAPLLTRDHWVRLQRAYLRAIRSYYAPRTLETMNRGLRAVHAASLGLRREGKASTMDPRRLKEADVAAFMGWMRSRRTKNGGVLVHGTQCNYVEYLNGFLRFEDNTVIDRMRVLLH